MPSPTTHTTFTKLIEKLLNSVDSYNANDLSRDTVGSSGYQAALAINKALGKIYDQIKDSKYLKAAPSTKIVTTANVDYVELAVEPYLDEIEAVTDTTNNITLKRRSWAWYRANFPDPSSTSGNPEFYIIRNERIYFAARPDSAITYTVDFVKHQKPLEEDGDTTLLPSTYDYWILSEAEIEWYKMLDSESVPQSAINERDKNRLIAVNAIMSGFDNMSQGASHWHDDELEAYPFDSPVGS